MSFGKKFTFDGASNYFDEEGRKIIDFLQGYQDNNRYYTVNPYYLSKREMMSLINMLGNANVKIKDYGTAKEVIYGMPTKYYNTVAEVEANVSYFTGDVNNKSADAIIERLARQPPR